MNIQIPIQPPTRGQIKKITEQAYHAHLGALPPCKWERVAPNSAAFHMSELVDEDIARWVIKIHDDYYTAMESYMLTPGQVYELVASHVTTSSEAA